MTETKVSYPGKIWENRIYCGKRFESGTEFTYQIYLPPAALRAKSRKLALFILLEHSFDPMCGILTSLMDEGVIPPGLVLFLSAGILHPTFPGGSDWNMRTVEFDEASREFSDLIVEELVPVACRIAKVTLDPSPDMHFITGGSSGGTLAFNAVWFRNDYFRRAYLSSPTFAAERGGDTLLAIVRKSEARPIRLYMTVGTEEPAGPEGSTLYSVLAAAEDFEFAGYDFRFELFQGEGHCCRRQDPNLWRRMSRFIWANWRKDPNVKTLYSQAQISARMEPEDTWKIYHGAMPAVQFPHYSFQEDKIVLIDCEKRKTVASDLGQITALRLSADGWRLFISMRDRRYVIAMSIMPDGTLSQTYRLAPLHLPHDCHYLGADDLAVLDDNFVLAATELGVQGIDPAGSVTMILPLPGDLPAHQVALRAGFLYAASGNKVFRRKLRVTPFAPLRPYPRRSHLLQ